jgi:hypothetical protein
MLSKRLIMNKEECAGTVTSHAIEVEFDGDTGDFYAAWCPVFVGAGGTGSEALEDLRAAAHLGVTYSLT